MKYTSCPAAAGGVALLSGATDGIVVVTMLLSLHAGYVEPVTHYRRPTPPIGFVRCDLGSTAELTDPGAAMDAAHAEVRRAIDEEIAFHRSSRLFVRE